MGSPTQKSSPEQDIAAMLKALPVFTAASETQIHALSRDARLVPLNKGKVLFHAGDVPRYFYSVITGCIQFAWTAPTGELRVVFMVKAGQGVADAKAFMGTPYKVTASAACDATLVAIPRNAMLNVLAQGGATGIKMMERLSMVVLDLVNEVESLTLKSGPQRVACFLLSSAPRLDTPRYELSLPSSKQAIASCLNLSKEAFSRVLREFRDAGLIQVNGRIVTVLDTERLRQWRQPALA